MNEAKEMKNGDRVIVLMEDEVVIGVFKEYDHPHVKLHGRYNPYPENLVYQYSRKRMSDLGIDDDDFVKNVEEILDEKMCLTLFR